MFTIKSVLLKLARTKSSLTSGDGLRAKTTRGGLWLISGTAAENVVRFVRNMIIVRLFAPELLGVYAIIVSVNYLIDSFSYVGVREAIIQNPRGAQRELLNTALLVSVIRGLGISLMGYVAVPFVATFYSKPEIAPLMQFALLGMVFSSAISPAAYSELREIRLKRWTLANQGGAVLSVVLSVVLCYYVRTLWALVIGLVAESFIKTVLSYVLFPFRPSLAISKEHLKTLMTFMRGMIGMPILLFLYERIDIFVLGKMVPDAELGIYSIAKSFVVTPVMIFGLLANQLLLPIFASQQNDLQSLYERYIKVLKWCALLMLPLLALLGCFAGPLLNLLYGPVYAGAATMVRWFCLTNALKIAGIVSASLLFALGKPELLRNSSIMRLVVMAAAVYPAILLWGTNGAAIAVFISMLVWQVEIFHLLARHMSTRFSSQAGALTGGAGLSAAVVALYVLALIGKHYLAGM